jgi:hypothetical protein
MPKGDKTMKKSEEILHLVHRSDRRKNPEIKQYRRISRQEAKNLTCGQEINMIDRQGKVANARINGKVRLWKRDKERIEIPCKYGLYEYFTLDKYNYDDIVIPIA